MFAAINTEALIAHIGHWIGLLGVLVIVGGILYGGGRAILEIASRKFTADEVYTACRQRMGRGLVLGLEVLVAADIVETVAIQPSFSNIGVLALIVAVRTFLGWSLSVELEGHWPWQKSKAEKQTSS